MFKLFKRSNKNEAAASGNDGQATEALQADAADLPPYAATPLGNARHTVENRFMHEYFFRNPTGFIDEITEQYGFLNLYCEVLREQRARRLPYREKDFGLDLTKMDNGDYLIICALPKPEFVGLCYRMYFLFSAQFDRLAYYTVEREEDGTHLYLWDKERNRTDLGDVGIGPWSEKPKEERNAELQMIAEAYCEKFGIPLKREPEESEEEQAAEAEEAETPVDADAAEPAESEDLEAPEGADQAEDPEASAPADSEQR